ncbi:MAG: hypothetical protein WA941_19515 [Nitrososphaeraceae archaeon]
MLRDTMVFVKPVLAVLHSLAICFPSKGKVLFSVSEHTAIYPIPGTSILDTLTCPPNCFTLAEYSSTGKGTRSAHEQLSSPITGSGVHFTKKR